MNEIERRIILKKVKSGDSASTISKSTGHSIDIIECVVQFQHFPTEIFENIRNGDIRGFVIEDIYQKTGIEKEKIKELLQSYTASEIITGKEIKVDRRNAHSW